MLTIDLDRMGIKPGARILDIGCGPGRHSWQAFHLEKVEVVSTDLSEFCALQARFMMSDMAAKKIHGGGLSLQMVADAGCLPFKDGAFDAIICSEVLEHIEDDALAVSEMARVAKPGARCAVSVPRAFPEKVCWRLNPNYPELAAGHRRIYKEDLLRKLFAQAGFSCYGRELAHGLHTPYWWLRCVADRGLFWDKAACAYERLLKNNITRRPRLTALADRKLGPVLAKSLVLYFLKQETG